MLTNSRRVDPVNDVECPRCHQRRGKACRSTVHAGKGPMVRSHTERVQAARRGPDSEPEPELSDAEFAMNGKWMAKERPAGAEPVEPVASSALATTRWHLVAWLSAPSGSEARILSDADLAFVNAVECPECNAPTGAGCQGYSHKTRSRVGRNHSPHYARVTLALQAEAK